MPQAKHAYITPALPRALPQSARKCVETAIESHLDAVAALAAFLDAADGDPDLEDANDDREPSLGALNSVGHVHGSFSGGFDQSGWGTSGTSDLEDAEDDCEADEDLEDPQPPMMDRE